MQNFEMGNLCNTIPIEWGNAKYYNLSIGEFIKFTGNTIKLVDVFNSSCTINVNGLDYTIHIARRNLPLVVEGTRIFLADSKNVKDIATDNALGMIHGLLKGDALICLSDETEPLLNPDKYVFPISKRDNYDWTMEETSHMFAYLGLSPFLGEGYYRSHEGIDLSMHDARGFLIHPVVAVESSTVCWVDVVNTDVNEGCVLLESDSQPDVNYVYKHLYYKNIFVSPGQHLDKGELIGYIWGDHNWGHLHFSVVHGNEPPEYSYRYQNLLNFFPQVYQLWYGDLNPHPKVWTKGDFIFGGDYWKVECRQHNCAYDDIVGYGWLLEPWCTADSVELTLDNVRLSRILFKGTAAEAFNPELNYIFSIRVEDGTYLLEALVGDNEFYSWQDIYINDIPVGVFDLPANKYKWTEKKIVKSKDGKIDVKLLLKDNHSIAGIKEIRFEKISNKR